ACTGVPRRDLEFILNANELSAEDTVASLATFEFFTDFGEAFQYSNQMVATGGYAAGVAAGGQPGDLAAGYGAALQERVLDPIGMDNTTLSFETVLAGGNHAVPHALDLFSAGGYRTIPLTIERVLLPVAPAGTHWSTVNDMARYMVTELGQGVAPGGARVVSAANLKETWEPQIPVDATTSYGLGWLVGDYKGLPLIHHGGNTLGFTSDFAFLPESGLGVIVMTNAGGSNHFNESVRTRLFELVFDQEPEAAQKFDFALQQIDRQMAELGGKLGAPFDAAALEPFAGSYVHPELGGLVLALAEDGLTADFGEFGAALKPMNAEGGEQNAFLMTDGPLAGTTVRLQRVGADQPEVVFEGAATNYTFERAP
ncbi:MAG TPA: serine hydrolase domain-containing protein, partial [Herpetosiphonaceae bacterium]|nr:serine hydrolase domain-containing protein [Herpetosiphonaceae bacterium]